MRNNKIWLATAAALFTAPLSALPAWAATCVTASVASYEAAGFSCSVGPLTFSGINLTTSVIGTAATTLTTLSPLTTVVGGATEYGLILNYSAVAVGTGTAGLSSADVAWTYNVTGAKITDAFLSLTAVDIATAGSSVGETLSNGTVLNLSGPGTLTATFAAVSSLGVAKDQDNFAVAAGSSAFSSILENGFSVSAVPVPAALPLFAGGLGLLGGVASWRKRKAGRAAAA